MKKEDINDGLSVFQNEKALLFGSDAYLLSAYISSSPKSNGCELGCGSGVISLMLLSRNKMASVTAYEIQGELAAVAAKNAEYNGFSARMKIISGDIRDIRASDGHFDTVFCNPPYLGMNTGKESAEVESLISRREVYGGIKEFASAASKLLGCGGNFYTVYRPDRLSVLMSSLSDNGMEPKRMTFVYPTEGHPPCLVLLAAKKGAREGVYVTPPLIIYKSARNMTNDGYTDEMKYIYENGDVNELYKRP